MVRRTAVLSFLCVALTATPGLAANLVTDPNNNCATSNPYPQGQESIRWTGGCRDGLLDGQGVLTWYRDGRWTERNEGTFRAGELHGDAITTFPDGSTIAGSYVDGRRHGEFVLARVNDTYSRSIFRNDQLVEEKPLTRQQMRALIDQRKAQTGQPRPAPAAAPAPAVVAAAPPAAAYVAAAPAAPVPVASAPTAFPLPAPAVSSMTHARAVSPPWSPIANAAAIAAYPPPAPPPRPLVAAPPAPAPQPVAAPAYIAPAAADPAPLANNLALPSARRVCTAPGLYPKGAGWCGVVRREQGESLEVEVTDIRLNSLFAIGIAPGECTGNEFVGGSTRGKRIWVPARCMQ
jgi:hypothetical protein